MIGQIHRHDIGRRQRLTGMGQQGFGIEFWVDDEHGAKCARGVHDGDVRLQVVVEGALGGVVEFF
ncbi:hypothetical protein D3C80_2207870 [compost metagenome]